ncbi:hypothetical protein OEB99_07275 [Actinotalea sp. M2MS4P-6]|uniref:hypothetical protein n=1 Tax=Actinotalea sp. M2MS4P-6 TaxID=2983762 RepID=UPI0021E43635|nr:hypothetical protein [Actinotalea sp. M2MS4P-6]MCV2394102.1 hypothetical protein [Actinotalea sp. M2MS4P-6]
MTLRVPGGRAVWWIATVLLVSACGASPHGEVRWPHGAGDWSGVGTDDVAPGDPVTLGGLVLCVDGAQTGEVLAVRAPEGSAVDVTAFTTRPQDRYEMYGGDRIALEDTGIPTGVGAVSTPCGAELGTELIVEVRSDGAAVARAGMLLVDYRVGSARGTTEVGFGVALCAPGVTPCVAEPPDAG